MAGWKEIKKKMMITRDVFVGREKEMDLIRENINPDKDLRIISIHGSGGAGKTSILREIKKRYTNDDGNPLILDIIDFYDITTHTLLGFTEAVVRKINYPDISCFDEYRKKRFDIEREAYSAVIKVKEDLFEKFKACFNKLTEHKRIVLLVDTFEEVQDVMGLNFAKLLNGLKNTTVVIAGRKNSEWLELVEEELGRKDLIKDLSLHEMDEADVQSLFNRVRRHVRIHEEELEKIHLLSEGKPILIILAIDPQWPGGVPAGEYSGALTRISGKYTLGELKSLSDSGIENVREEFRRDLIHVNMDLFDTDETFKIIKYMAILYKFFNERILNAVLGTDLDAAEEHFSEIKKWPFIKYYEESGGAHSYFLHDVLREMIIKYYWRYIGAEHVISDCYNKIIHYYRTLFEENALKENKKIDEYNKAAADSRPQVLIDLADIKRRRQSFKADQIYYHICANLIEGLKSYHEVHTNNIWVGHKEANKLAKQCKFNALKDLGYDGKTVPYPQELIIMDQLDGAMTDIVVRRKFDKGLKRLLELIGLETSDIVYMEDINVLDIDQYFLSDILIYLGVGFNYTGESNLAEKVLRQAIDLLKVMEVKLEHPDNIDEIDTMHTVRSLSRAFGNLGYCYLMSGKLSEAVESFESAIPLCYKGRISVEQADFFNDMAMAQMQLGLKNEALFNWEKGYEIRKRQLFENKIGLSLNTKGLILYLADHLPDALESSQEALEIFKKIKMPDGIGRAKRAIGAILSRIGQKDKNIEKMGKAEKYLNEAAAIFQKGGKSPEPPLMADIYEKYGLLFKDYSLTYKNQHHLYGREPDIEHSEYYFNEAKKHFDECIAFHSNGKNILRLASGLEKKSRLYMEHGRIDDVEKILDLMEERLENNLVNECGDISGSIQKVLNNKRYELIYPYGKLMNGRAQVAFYRFSRSRDNENPNSASSNVHFLNAAAEYYTLACELFTRYSEESYATIDANKTIMTNVSKLNAKEKDIFVDQVKITLRSNGLTPYHDPKSRIARLIKKSELYQGMI